MSKYRVGDKVNWLGAIGKIIDILEDESLVIEFSGKIYFFNKDGSFLPEQEPTLRVVNDA